MSAEAWIIGLHLLTQHAPDCDHELQTVTPGAYVVSPSGLTAGLFRNSLGHPAAYVGLTVEQPVFNVTLGVMAYDKGRHMRWSPMVTPSLKLGDFRLAYLAPFRKSSNAVHLSWETSL